MKLLLDTQCFLWCFAEPERLNPTAIEQIVAEDNELFFSVASVWEIAIKVGIGKLPLPEPVDTYVASRMRLLGVKYLDILFPHACKVATLPLLHRDPFDRILVSQAQIENMTLVTADEVLTQYGVDVLWSKA
ncbi:type II toxin-antitoxin system VapC family toxin [Chamaesiphon sp. VAR_48_metabat_403]|uniref:type II toxin-antitoxin system VapC family toxin n=1 Tax=Chamaesiphon sp. VAR_48_metabat_403 TaxID=2964700 RepID=UPI00286E4AAF|nr:type II toxin-antitoxin system VapC family toxin [Chamaesiphon sp. VAR_48_metabat_403]